MKNFVKRVQNCNAELFAHSGPFQLLMYLIKKFQIFGPPYARFSWYIHEANYISVLDAALEI